MGDDKSPTTLFVQTSCQITIDKMPKRQIFGLYVGCTAVFVYLFTLVYFDYIKTKEKSNFVDYDVKTITAGDYSIEFDLDEETYNAWKDDYCDNTNFLPECAQFKTFITQILEHECTHNVPH